MCPRSSFVCGLLWQLCLDVGYRFGMAVSADEKWLMEIEGTLPVYSLPGGELVRTFGGEGDGSLQFNSPRRLCFAPNGNIIVVDSDSKLLQEVTLEGGSLVWESLVMGIRFALLFTMTL